MSYDIKNLPQDTKDFMATEYGQYVMAMLDDQRDAYLSSAAANDDILFLAKYSALKEITESIRHPLDDDIPSRG